MDEFIDPFLSSAWPDLNISSSSSWADTVASQSNSLLAGSIEAPSMCMIPTSHIIGNAVAEDLDLHAHSDNSSVFRNGHLKGLDPSQHENETQESNFTLKDAFESNSASGSYGQELNTSYNALTMSSSIESNGSEPSKFAQSLGDAHSISSVPSMWPSSYSGVSSFMEQGKLQGFGFHGVESHTYVENDKYPHLNNSMASSLQDCNELRSASLSNFNLGQQMKQSGGLHPHQQLQEQNGLHNLHVPSFSVGPLMTLSKSPAVQTHQQLSQSTQGNTLKHQIDPSSGVQQHANQANGNACNGAAKPRVRARRGQATDPHSIAERLRREKIAERMKSLQELVPNSNKADKASMLDEIIDYVKFLQLQVKVLSMSRLGAAGAVVPLITDGQAEGTRTLHLSSAGQGGDDLSDAEDNLAFEQEVAKLMESNVTSAMQYLQNKGLCLMPIALASAINTQKGSYSASIPPERRNGCNGGAIKKEEAVKSQI